MLANENCCTRLYWARRRFRPNRAAAWAEKCPASAPQTRLATVASTSHRPVERSRAASPIWTPLSMMSAISSGISTSITTSPTTNTGDRMASRFASPRQAISFLTMFEVPPYSFAFVL